MHETDHAAREVQESDVMDVSGLASFFKFMIVVMMAVSVIMITIISLLLWWLL